MADGRDKTGKFIAGHKSIGGRPVGSRNRLGERFLDDLQAIWKKRGKKALEQVAEANPDILVKVVASLMPRQLIAQSNVRCRLSVYSTKQRISRRLIGSPGIIST